MRDLLATLRGLFTSAAPPPFVDPQLGTLLWADDENAWRVPPTPDFPYHILLTPAPGAMTPGKESISRARQLMADGPGFRSRLTGFLAAARASFPTEVQGEIDMLFPDVITLYSHDPGLGMIFFAGNDSKKVWHCEVKEGELRHLRFDDA
jgi:hypothetical protein